MRSHLRRWHATLLARTTSVGRSGAFCKSRMLLSLNCDLIFESHGVTFIWHMMSLNIIIAPFKCSKASFHFVALVASFQLPKAVVLAAHLNSLNLNHWWENNFSCLNLDRRIIDLRCDPMIWSLCTCTTSIKNWVNVFISLTPQITHFCRQYSQKTLKSLCASNHPLWTISLIAFNTF